MRNILFALLVLLVLTAGCLEEQVGTIVYREAVPETAAETVVEEMPMMGEEEHVHAEVPDEYAGFSENPYWYDLVADYDTAKAEGQEIYVAKCQSCHGASGLGEEETFIPGAAGFADAAMTAEMSDAFWYWRVAEGVSGTPMPAWKDQLTEDEIWMAMVYEHSFSHDEPHVHEAHAEEETQAEEGHIH